MEEIKEWLRVNAEIALLKAETKTRSKRKKELTARLLAVMKQNGLDSYTLQEGKGGALVPQRRKSKKAISKKYLEEQLALFFVDAPEVGSNAAHFVLEHRTEVVTEDLRHKA